MRRLSTIPLRADDKVPGELAEGWADTKGVARWRIKTIYEERGRGSWTGNDRTLPIRLTRLPFAASGEFDSPCGSLEFVRPIIAATQIVKSAARVHGLRSRSGSSIFLTIASRSKASSCSAAARRRRD